MKLGLLGIDARIAEVVAAAIRRGDTLVLGCDLPVDGPFAAAVPAAVPRTAAWQDLLDPQSCDAVLVGRDGWSEARAEAVRALVQAGRTLLVGHPPCLSMLWAYELDMIRGDVGGRLLPCLPDRLHPFIQRLQEAIRAGLAGAAPGGPVETITMERRLADRSREKVLDALASDVDLVRVLVGEPSRLSTLGAAEGESAWGALAVGFSGPAQVPVRWQVARGGEPGLSISLMHAQGHCSATIPDDSRLPWTWSGPEPATATFDRGAALLDLLHGSMPDHDLAPAAWADAARAIELAETVPRSLAKGRSIELHQEEFSELGTFRGTMASLGCGLVLAALFVLVLATLLGGIARESGWAWGERIAGIWPQAVLAVLGLFLTLQLLPMLVGNAASRSGEGARADRRRVE
jgi:myo-inositol 2-dehydrogenase/D-chiro-inositol 1-dehydrogenase